MTESPAVWKRNLLFISMVLLALTMLAIGLFQSPASSATGTGNERPVSLPQASETVARVDAEFQTQWKERGLQSASRATELQIARRVSLALTGAIPSLEELRNLESIPAGQRVAYWTNRLLADRRYADYLAERLARVYVGTEGGPFVFYRRRRFVRWLGDQLAENRPYDQIVRDVISGTGLWTDSPAVNFLTVTVSDDKGGQPDPVRLAGRTTRAFLGMRIDCVQCHDDPMGIVELGTDQEPRYGTQADFHQLAAFFADAKVSLLGVTDQPNEYKTKYLGADEEQEVPPVVPFCDELCESKGSKRSQLARWVTNRHNKQFARATVNRMWALLFGRPLVEPIDDICLHGPFPPGMETLADDFLSHGYDMRRLVRVIVMTRVFQQSSRANAFEVTPRHEEAWAVFPLSRLRPEQVAGSLIQACSLTTINAKSHIFAQLMSYAQQNEFVRRYGDMGEDEFEDRGGTVTQRLLMMNGDLVKERTKENVLLNAATRVAVLAPSDSKAVEIAYLSVLSRRPTTAERRHFCQRLQEAEKSGRNRAMEDLYWVLLNSTEFSWNH